jgi:hypothetical protein
MRSTSSWLLTSTVTLMACSGDPVDIKTDEVQITVADGSIRLDEDSAAAIVLAAESDATPITFEILTEPALGQLIGSGAQWEFVPDPDVNGEDSFTWRALAGGSASANATMTLFIDAVNDAPTGVGTQLGTSEDTPVSDRLQALDVEGDPLTWTLVSAPESGRVDLEPGTGDFTYTPDPNFTGQDSFLWSAFDVAGAGTGPVRVDVSVVESNDPPQVQADSFVLPEDTWVDGDLSGDDPDGDSLTWRVDSDVTNGTLTLNTNLGTFTYTPTANYFGPDAFTVVASDGMSDSAPVVIDLVITSVNDAPMVPSAILEVGEDAVLDATLAATDVEGDTLSFRVDSPPRNGVLALDPASGQVTYTPASNWSGVDDFTVVAADGSVDSLPGRVTVVVQPVNDPPTASGGALLLTNEDTAVAGAIRGADPEGDPLTYVVSTAPLHGTLTLSASTGDYVYTPSQDYNGNDLFGIQAFDGEASSGAAIVTVQVLSLNDPPRIAPASLTVVEGGSGSLALPAVDPEGDTLYFLISTPALFGTASVDSLTGLLEYTPDAGFSGQDVLVYTVTDGQASSDGFLPITVAPDGDGDEVADISDNCPEVANASQGDVNGNGFGDACDCFSTSFDATLDPGIWADSDLAVPVTSTSVSPSHAVALQGDGAFLQTVPLPGGCDAHLWELQVELGTPPPELGDALVISARTDGGPWIVVEEIFGTGSDVSFQPMLGSTAGLGLDGAVVEFRIEVVADELDDVFTIDDPSLSCDTDADWLPDCVETFIEGYDLTVADADGDGWLDGDEYAAGTDPFLADTDLDGFEDPADNCPTAFNPTQVDTDGNGYGDACDNAIHDDFDLGTFDPAVWTSAGVVGDGEVTNLYFESGTHSLNLGGGGATLEALPIDFQACTSVAWDLRVKKGPETPETADHTYIEAWDGFAWVIIGDIPGGTATATFIPILGSTTSPSVLVQGARIQLRSAGTGATFDDFYVDDIVMGCDADGDQIPNYKEINTYQTNPDLADTDGDGQTDGTEILMGTDPLDSTSF